MTRGPLHFRETDLVRAIKSARRAEAGWTVHQIASWSGHKTLKEVERYTKAADQNA